MNAQEPIKVPVLHIHIYTVNTGRKRLDRIITLTAGTRVLPEKSYYQHKFMS